MSEKKKHLNHKEQGDEIRSSRKSHLQALKDAGHPDPAFGVSMGDAPGSRHEWHTRKKSGQDTKILGEPGHAPAATHEMYGGREEYRGSEFQQRRAEARGKISQ